MLTHALPSAGILKCLNDQVQVFDDIISLSKINREIQLGPQVLKNIQDVRNAVQHLEKEYKKLVDGISGFGATALVSSPTIQQLARSANLHLRNPVEFHLRTALVENGFIGAFPTAGNDRGAVNLQPALGSSLAMKVDQNLDLSSNPWNPANIIFATDFDDTCTIVDSSGALVKAAEAAAKKTSEDFLLGKMVDEYNAILDRHSERTKVVLDSLEHPEQSGRARRHSLRRDEAAEDEVAAMDPLLRPYFEKTVHSSSDGINKRPKHDALDDGGLRKALLRLSDLEVICNEEVMSSGVLRGSGKEEILVKAKEVDIRPHCHQVLQELSAVGTAIHIVSANWSRDLVKGGLPELPEGQLFVHCNNLSFDEVGSSTGFFDMTMVNAFDKEQMLLALRKLYTSTPKSSQISTDSNCGPNTGEKMLVYLGDSHTDLLGLLEADLGILIGNSKTTRRVMSLYGIRLLPIWEASAFLSLARLNGSQRSWRRSGVLFEASGWDEVDACLFKISSTNTKLGSFDTEKDIESSQQQLQNPQDLAPPMNLELVGVAC